MLDCWAARSHRALTRLLRTVPFARALARSPSSWDKGICLSDCQRVVNYCAVLFFIPFLRRSDRNGWDDPVLDPGDHWRHVYLRLARQHVTGSHAQRRIAHARRLLSAKRRHLGRSRTHATHRLVRGQDTSLIATLCDFLLIWSRVRGLAPRTMIAAYNTVRGHATRALVWEERGGGKTVRGPRGGTQTDEESVRGQWGEQPESDFDCSCWQSSSSVST